MKLKFPQLSIKGIMVMNKGHPTKQFNWGDAICDAAILAGIGFLTAFGGAGVAGASETEAVIAAGVAAGTQFLTILALKRNLIKK